jgi:autotransporter-associated beta strand protein
MNWKPGSNILFLITVFTGLGVGRAMAGSGGENMLLVVNPSDPASLQIANAYAALRDIPANNIVYITPPSDYHNDGQPISQAEVMSDYLNPISAAISARGLTNQINYIGTIGQPVSYFINADPGLPDTYANSMSYALSLLTPLTNGSGLTLQDAISHAYGTALYMPTSGLYQNPTNIPVGDNPAITHSASHTTTFFPSAGSYLNINTQYYMAGAIGYTGTNGNTAAQVISSLQSAVASDGTRPTGTIYFEDSGDKDRSGPRGPEWPYTQAQLTARGISAVYQYSTTPGSSSAVLGAVCGASNLPLPNGSTYVPGSWADNLTSYGCDFPDTSQTKATEFITAGASGTTGSVIEPYNIPQRFTNTSIYTFIADGSTLGEAFAKSVATPDIQLPLGDMLAQPFADVPKVTFTAGPVNYGPALGSISISGSAGLINPQIATGISSLELLVDGLVTSTNTPVNGSGTFDLSTAGLSDGVHEVRLVGINNSQAASEGYAAQQIVVDNHGRSISFNGGNLTLTSSSATIGLSGTAGDGAVSQVELTCLGRVVAQAGGSPGSLSLSPMALAPGDNVIVPVAVYTDGMQVAGGGFVVHVESGPVNGWNNGAGTWLWSNTGNWSNGLLPENLDGVARFSGATSGGTVTLDVSPTLAEIAFDNSGGGNYTIAGLPGQTLTLSTTNGAAAESLVNVLSGSHTLSVPLVLAAPGNLFNVTNAIDSLTVNGNVSGVGALTKTGNGLLLLAGSNTYLGATTVSAGTLQLGANAALPAGTTAMVNGTLDLNTFNANVSVLAGDGSIIHSGTGGSTLTVGSGVFAGAIANDNGTLALFKTGNGQLTLSGSNTYSGGTIVGAGLLTAANTASLPGFASGAVTVDPGATLAVQPAGNSGWGNTQISALLGGVHWSDSTAAFGIDTTFGDFTFGGNIAPALGLTKLGANTLSLSGSNTYSGVTAIDAGILSLASSAALGGGSITFGGGVLQFTSSNTRDYSAQFVGSVAAPIAIDTNGQTVIFGSSIAAGNTAGLVKIGNGMLTLSGSNGYTGGTTVGGGTLVAASNSALSSGTVVLASSNATALIFTSAAPSIGSLAGSGSSAVLLGNASANSPTLLTVGTDNSSTAYSGTIGDLASAAPAAIGSLAKAGSGTLTLTGVNTYSGMTSVTAGALSVASTASLPGYNSPGKVGVAGGAVLAVQLGNGTTGWSSPQVATLLGNVNWSNSNAILGIDTSSGNATYSANLTAPIGLEKLGANLLLLTGSNSYTGPTTVSAGTLTIGDGSTQGTGFSSPSVAVNSGTTITFNLPNNQSYGGTISGPGQLLKAGSGQLTLTGNNSLSGTITVTAGGLGFDSPAALPSASSIVTNGGTLDLGGNTFTQTGASICFAGGVLQNGSLLYAGTYSAVPASGVTATVAANLGGSAGLNMTGAGTLLLTGVNTYSGSTSVGSGVLEAATTAALPGYNTANAVSVAGGAVLAVQSGGATAGWNAPQITSLLASANWATNSPNNTPALGIDTTNGDFSYGGSLPQSIGLTKMGANNLTLTAANTIMGNLVSNGPGTMTIANNFSFDGVDGGYNALGIVQIHQGQINVVSGGALTNTSEIDLGDTPGQTGTLSLTSGTAVVNFGSNGWSGVNVGFKGGTGILSLTGNSLLDATPSNGVGFINVIDIAFGTGSAGTASVAGNAIMRNNGGSFIAVGDGGTGTLTISQSGFVQTSYLQVGSILQSGQSGGAGTLYLNGGTLSLPQIQNAQGSTGTVYFNGGSLQASASSPDFLTLGYEDTLGTFHPGGGTLNAYVQAGGALIDTNGNNITINLPLAHDPGLGAGSDGGLTKVGSGSLTLTAANTYNGGTTINAGALAISTPANLGSGGLTFGGSGAGTLAIVGATGFSSSLSITLSQNGTIQQDDPGTVTLTGPISGSGNLIMSGSGVLALNGTNSSTGETIVSSGTLEVLNSLALSNNGLIVGGDAGLLFGEAYSVNSPVLGQGIESLSLSERGLAGGEAAGSTAVPASTSVSASSLNSVPEPGTLLLLLVAGGSGLIWLLRRESKAARRGR